MKYKELLRFGYEELEAHQIADAKVDAFYLFEYVFDMNRSAYLLHMEDAVTEETLEKLEIYKQFIKKRCLHVPLQYITGSQEFMGLEFMVNEHVLIPRQDTETIVEKAIDLLKKQADGETTLEILDMCTGSGCILLSILSYVKGVRGLGVDISLEALEVAKENAKRLDLLERASFCESDLFAGIQTNAFDMIVSNPPYIATKELETLMPEVIAHEPRGALDGHESGLFFYEKICKEAPSYLKENGYLLFEIGYDQGTAVKERMEAAGFLEVSVCSDYSGNDRLVMGHL